MSSIDVLAKHQRHALGMADSAPDRCACGAEIHPNRSDAVADIDIMVRRDFAFAVHQVDALRAGC